MKLCWTTLSVKNMEESLKFYKEIVGLKENRRFSSAPGVEFVFLGEGETELELICEQNKGDINVAQDISLGFQVDSLDRMMELVKENGYAIHSGPIQPNPHVRFFFVLDPNGWKIQFVEML